MKKNNQNKAANGLMNARLYRYGVGPEFKDVLKHKLLRPDEYYLDPEPCSFIWLTFSPQWEIYSAQISEDGKGCQFGSSNFTSLPLSYTRLR